MSLGGDLNMERSAFTLGISILIKFTLLFFTVVVVALEFLFFLDVLHRQMGPWTFFNLKFFGKFFLTILDV